MLLLLLKGHQIPFEVSDGFDDCDDVEKKKDDDDDNNDNNDG